VPCDLYKAKNDLRDVNAGRSLRRTVATFAGWRRLLHASDFVLKTTHHFVVAVSFGDINALLKNLDGARYVALADEIAGFAENSRVALAFFGGCHG